MRVALEELSAGDPLAIVDGQANALEIDTWPLGRLVITQRDGGLEKTAYALRHGSADGGAPAADGIGGVMAAPLSGLTILDLSRVLSGPYCTMLAADMGARVIKIEHPVQRRRHARVGTALHRGRKRVLPEHQSQQGKRGD